jgi:hypothetical protein
MDGLTQLPFLSSHKPFIFGLYPKKGARSTYRCTLAQMATSGWPVTRGQLAFDGLN